MLSYAKLSGIGALILICGYTVFATEWQTPEEKMAEAIKAQNEAITKRNQLSLEQYKRQVTDCYDSASGTEDQKVTRFTQCGNIPIPELQELIPTSGNKSNETVVSASGGIIPEPSQSGITTYHIAEPKDNPCVDWKSTPKTVVLHYTDTSYDTTIQAIANGHKARFGVEYYIAYHYIIKKNGDIVSTRPESCGSIAVKDEAMNLQAIHIAYMGDGKPTQAQLKSLVTLTRNIQNKYGMSRSDVTAHADIQAKNKQESMEGMFGSKDAFVKMLREQDKVTIYGKESPELTYMWQAWGDKDFIGTLFQESRLNNKTIGDGGSSIGYCQIHQAYQPEWYEEYSKLKTMAERLNYCNEKYALELSKYGYHGKYFHGYYKKDKHIANLSIQ